MTEKEIKLLGFEIQEDDSDESNPFSYYVYEVCNGLTFITNSNDEITTKDGWYVEFFNTEIPIRYTQFSEVQSLLNNIQKHIIK